jgi:hypothetical protein
MSIVWTVDPLEQRAVLTITDPHTIEDWRAAVTGILDDARLNPGFAVLVDRRGSAPATTKFVEQMTAFFAANARTFTGVRAAILVDTETAFGMGRMTGLRSELDTPGLTVRTFRSYDEAVAWLSTGEPLA